MAYRYPWVLLACLLACLTACWLGSENGEWRRFFIEAQRSRGRGDEPTRAQGATNPV